MFKCDKCKKVSKLGELCTLVITGKRDRVYKNVVKKGRNDRELITRGWEIEKEEKRCPKCATSGASELTTQKVLMRRL